MTAYQIDEIKVFMASLFNSELFDSFFVSEIEIKTYVTSKISGVLNRKWYQDEEQNELEVNEFATWKQVKSIVYELIKGKKTPEIMNLSFFHPLDGGDNGAMRVHFQDESLQIITAYNAKEFSLDKSKEREWDEKFRDYLTKKGFSVSTQLK